jgi:hypothetical protein
MQGTSWPAQKILASREGLCFMGFDIVGLLVGWLVGWLVGCWFGWFGLV